jgi:hypothetical protein
LKCATCRASCNEWLVAQREPLPIIPTASAATSEPAATEDTNTVQTLYDNTPDGHDFVALVETHEHGNTHDDDGNANVMPHESPAAHVDGQEPETLEGVVSAASAPASYWKTKLELEKQRREAEEKENLMRQNKRIEEEEKKQLTSCSSSSSSKTQGPKAKVTPSKPKGSAAKHKKPDDMTSSEKPKAAGASASSSSGSAITINQTHALVNENAAPATPAGTSVTLASDVPEGEDTHEPEEKRPRRLSMKKPASSLKRNSKDEK